MTRKNIFFTLTFFVAFTIFKKSQAQEAELKKNFTKVPIYRSPEDSSRLAQASVIFQTELNKTPINRAKSDSLGEITWNLQQHSIVGKKTIFYGNPDFTPLDSLQTLSDLSMVTNLSVTGRLTKIPPIIYRCTNLQQVEFVNTYIHRIPRKLNRLRKLQGVGFFNNNPKSRLLSSRSKRITNLIINGSDPAKLPRSFAAFPALKILDLSENHLSRFPSRLHRNKKLKEISLMENNLTLSEKNIKGNKSIERLSLQYNKIPYLPGWISEFPELIRLSLNYNLITDVDPGIIKLKKIKAISFYANQLPKIPEPVYALSSLEAIDLFYNEIEALDTTLSKWENLSILYLAHNKVVFLPENLNRLRGLYALYIDHNRIDHIPESVGDLRFLTVLKANHNFLKEVPSSVLRLDSLEELDISNNYITDIPPEIFDFRNYKIFSLANNPWSNTTKKFLMKKVQELRSRDVFVHVMGEQDDH